jgi:hypothetical protein
VPSYAEPRFVGRTPGSFTPLRIKKKTKLSTFRLLLPSTIENGRAKAKSHTFESACLQLLAFFPWMTHPTVCRSLRARTLCSLPFQPFSLKSYMNALFLLLPDWLWGLFAVRNLGRIR